VAERPVAERPVAGSDVWSGLRPPARTGPRLGPGLHLLLLPAPRLGPGLHPLPLPGPGVRPGVRPPALPGTMLPRATGALTLGLRQARSSLVQAACWTPAPTAYDRASWLARTDAPGGAMHGDSSYPARTAWVHGAPPPANRPGVHRGSATAAVARTRFVAGGAGPSRPAIPRGGDVAGEHGRMGGPREPAGAGRRFAAGGGRRFAAGAGRRFAAGDRRPRRPSPR